MRKFQVKVKVANPAQPEKSFEEMFWVDTGVQYTFMPEDRLNSIGLEPLRSHELILSDGWRDRRMLGEALLTVAEPGGTLSCPVVFARTGSLYLLGSTAMEGLGVEADPTEQRFKRNTGLTGTNVPIRPV